MVRLSVDLDLTTESLITVVIGVETARHSATLALGKPGVLHGVRTYLLQSPSGQIMETHSISAGLDYPVSIVSGSFVVDLLHPPRNIGSRT
jgi:tryptophan synthase beta subunit